MGASASGPCWVIDWGHDQSNCQFPRILPQDQDGVQWIIRLDSFLLVQDLYAGLKKIVTIEDRIVRLADDVKRLQLDLVGHGERPADLPDSS